MSAQTWHGWIMCSTERHWKGQIKTNLKSLSFLFLIPQSGNFAETSFLPGPLISHLQAETWPDHMSPVSSSSLVTAQVQCGFYDFTDHVSSMSQFSSQNEAHILRLDSAAPGSGPKESWFHCQDPLCLKIWNCKITNIFEIACFLTNCHQCELVLFTTLLKLVF